MTPEGVGLTTILTFLGGFSLGGTMMFVIALDHFAKRLEEARDVAYGMGYANGLRDSHKPGASIQWAAGHGPEDHPGKL